MNLDIICFVAWFASISNMCMYNLASWEHTCPVPMILLVLEWTQVTVFYICCNHSQLKMILRLLMQLWTHMNCLILPSFSLLKFTVLVRTKDTIFRVYEKWILIFRVSRKLRKESPFSSSWQKNATFLYIYIYMKEEECKLDRRM